MVDLKSTKKMGKEEEKAEEEEKKPEIEGLKKQIEDYKATLQRLQAEFENYKKRVEKEKIELVEYGKAEVIKKLLPVLDSFELALRNQSFNTNEIESLKKDALQFRKGVDIIYSQFYSILRNEGLKPIEAVNKKFDPYLHEVLMHEHSDKEEDLVLEEFQKGFMLKDNVLRHSKVKIAKK